MTGMFIKIENGKLVKSEIETDLYIEWDGVYWNFYGKSNPTYAYNGKVYDCFPIVTISEDLSRVVAIEMFGCEGDNQFDDGYLDIDINLDDWEEIRPFNDLMRHNYHIVGFILHPEGNYDNDAEGIADYNEIVRDEMKAVELLLTKYRVESDAYETFVDDADYHIDEDADGIYLFKRVD